MTSTEPIVSVRNVSKIYPEHGGSVTLRQEGTRILRHVFRGLQASPDDEVKGFQALKDVNFDVYPGEGFALIGRNGSGKTTMIRLLANIMRPTTGTIEVKGRYTALIGLGTGFLPDMTGRENIYLNAAIYGVPPKETEHRIEEIIAFADIGEFIDHRVRDYSSGMRARLGFSVAVHIFPDIIMVDEALAVGDAAFRQKCNEKIDTLLAQNRTLILVSHAAAHVRRLCQRAVWLHDGEVMMKDDAKLVLQEYNKFMKIKKGSGEN